ncbi:unnamed protein product [Symbiodinium natans]|uniref:Uncharacterized protein n=1 Tax=Symbiodinium natans TaxID=878477 RepID=A0A812P1D4_9DINO|nr:unnamed protein product [Symbiodinium natans]
MGSDAASSDHCIVCFDETKKLFKTFCCEKRVVCEDCYTQKVRLKGLIKALTQCTKLDGFSSLASRPSQRLYPDGNLLPDSVGWETLTEPGPIRQVQDELEQLHVTAEKAQVMLESLIAPKDHAWRPGELRHKPSAVPMASFAYSYGVKSMEAAETKAMVRFGPAEDKRRYRHVLDMARIGLVFPSCDFLQDALDLILNQFEVVDVRNGFRTPCRTGDRFVEVLLILEVETEDGPMPHVCEVRLDEINFYNARARAEPVMQELLGKISKHYSNKHPRCMEHLSRWVLESPGMSHGLRSFKKHLLRRFGSALGAWRRHFGLSRLVPFHKFRNLCKEMQTYKHSTEYWQELDMGRAGCISLFELDAPSVCMLATFRARLLKLANVPSEEATPEDLWLKMTQIVQPARSDRFVINEFTFILTRALGFSAVQATTIFDLLDSDGGHTFHPPGLVRQTDIAWLVKLPMLVDLSAVALRSDGFNGQEPIPDVAWTPKRHGSASGASAASPNSDLPYQRAFPGSPTSPVSPNFLQSYGDLEGGDEDGEVDVVAPPVQTIPPHEMVSPSSITPSSQAPASTPAETPPQGPVVRRESDSRSAGATAAAAGPAVSQETSSASAPYKAQGRQLPEEEGQQELEGSTVLVQKTVTLDVDPQVQEIDGQSDGYYEGEEGEEEDEVFDLSELQDDVPQLEETF